MDELALIRSFDPAPSADPAARAAARTALLRRIESRSVPVWRRRRIVVATVAFAALVLAAAAFGGRLLDLFEGKPAPPAVKRALKLEIAGFRRMTGGITPFAPLPGGYRASRTRGILAVRTPLGRVFIWGVSTVSGNVCTVLQRQGGGTENGALQNGFCIGPKTQQPAVLWAATSITFGNPSTSHWDTTPVLYGHVTPSVRSVELRLQNGTMKKLRVVEGFFAASLPAVAQKDSLVGRDARGHTVDREQVPIGSEPGAALLPVYGRARILVEINERDGAPLALILEKCRYGTALDYSTGGGGSLSCQSPGFGLRRSERIALSFGSGGTPGETEYFLHGDAGTRTTTLDIVYRDGTKVEVPTPGGWALYEFPPGRNFGDLKELVAYDHDGRKIDSRPFSRYSRP